MLSNELQIGKAGEHLVCCDLIMNGFNAFLADQGLPYDVLLDMHNVILRIQCRASEKLQWNRPTRGVSQQLYIYNLKRGKHHQHTLFPVVDLVAFVALDLKSVAYLPLQSILNKKGEPIQIIAFRSPHVQYQNRVYSTGTIRKTTTRYITNCPIREALAILGKRQDGLTTIQTTPLLSEFAQGNLLPELHQ